MRTVSIRLADLDRGSIPVGFAGENLHTQVRIDCKKAYEEYPAAVVGLIVKNPNGDAYPAVTVRDGDIVTWDVTNADLAYEGTGEIQLTFTVGEVVKKSYIGRIRIDKSILNPGETPDPIKNWIDQANEILEEVQDAVPEGGTTGQVLAKKSDSDRDTEWVDPGSGGTTDYDQLENRPQIAGVTLTGDVSLHDLGAAAESDIPDVSGFYTKPSGGIPDTDLASGVQTSLGKADTAYQKPSGGIPADDIASGVIPDPTSIIDDTAGDGDTNKVWSADKSSSLLTEINSRYTKPDTGIPATDMEQAVQTSLGKADSAYQKPSGGIPGTDLADSYIKEPSSDGTNGQVLTTDGNGGRLWTTVQGGGGSGVSDVQANGTSIVSQGVANIPIATGISPGLVEVNSSYGVGKLNNDGVLYVVGAQENQIKGGTEYYRCVMPERQHFSVFYGLSKIAGYDLKNVSVTSGTYPSEAIDKILQMLGVFDLIAQHETTPSTHAYAQGECFIFNGKLCRATSAISVADAITIGTNCEQTTLMAEINR